MFWTCRQDHEFYDAGFPRTSRKFPLNRLYSGQYVNYCKCSPQCWYIGWRMSARIQRKSNSGLVDCLSFRRIGIHVAKRGQTSETWSWTKVPMLKTWKRAPLPTLWWLRLCFVRFQDFVCEKLRMHQASHWNRRVIQHMKTAKNAISFISVRLRIWSFARAQVQFNGRRNAKVLRR